MQSQTMRSGTAMSSSIGGMSGTNLMGGSLSLSMSESALLHGGGDLEALAMQHLQSERGLDLQKLGRDGRINDSLVVAPSMNRPSENTMDEFYRSMGIFVPPGQ